MKFLDALLGRSKPKQPKLDALFGVTGAAVTLEAAAGMKPTGQAAVCFKPASGQGFAAASEELQGLLELAVKEAGSSLGSPTTATATAGWCSPTRRWRTW